MSNSLKKLSDRVASIEVSAANIVTEAQALKAQISALTASQEDSAALDALEARLAVVQAAIDAVATPAAAGA